MYVCMDGLRTDRQNTDGPLNYGHPRTASPAMPWAMAHAMMHHDRTAIQSFKNTDMNMHACITHMRDDGPLYHPERR